VIENTRQAPSEAKAIEPFTGKITKDRVRLRLQPTLDGFILKEFQKNATVVVTGVADEFYAILPNPDVKGYIFRTYVLDGEIVGNHVNVRLEPDTNSNIICQLNSGDKIKGIVAKENNRWLEIELPQSARFYVAKDYVSKAGPESLFYTLNKKREDLNERLSIVDKAITVELQKPFRDIQLKPFAHELKNIITQSNDFPEQAEQANTLLKKMQEAYLQKSVGGKEEPVKSGKASAKKTKAQKNQAAQEQMDEKTAYDDSDCEEKEGDNKKDAPQQSTKNVSMPVGAKKDAAELETQNATVAQNQANEQVPSLATTQANTQEGIVTLKGIVKPYLSHAKNAPGQFLLINPQNNLPHAFLTSRDINLNTVVGKEVTVSAIETTNNHFAYPAYVVLQIKQ
ncbi:MAG TPA: SH3 domain-containing protein, partial [Chlamydiales bacterium]|nr:SH3 domain-containing protein [Chlamydiales bacterium]